MNRYKMDNFIRPKFKMKLDIFGFLHFIVFSFILYSQT